MKGFNLFMYPYFFANQNFAFQDTKNFHLELI